MVDYDDYDISSVGLNKTPFDPSALVGWNVRRPTRAAQRWSVLNGLIHGLVWAFPFVTAALLWRRVAGADGTAFWPTLLFIIGMLLLLMLLIKGIVLPRTWWFAYNDHELIVEHGLVIKARDHLTFDRVQYRGAACRTDHALTRTRIAGVRYRRWTRDRPGRGDGGYRGHRAACACGHAASGGHMSEAAQRVWSTIRSSIRSISNPTA